MLTTQTCAYFLAIDHENKTESKVFLMQNTLVGQGEAHVLLFMQCSS